MKKAFPSHIDDFLPFFLDKKESAASLDKTTMKTKLGIFGGTFAPIHNGHINAATAFYDAMELDRLIIMPTFIPPHKTISQDDDPERRLVMCRLAFGGETRKIEVSDHEIKQGGKSYTYLTLKHYAAPDRDLTFLVGTDMFLSLDRWRQPEEIFSLARIALIRREASDGKLEKSIYEAKERYRVRYNADIADIKCPAVEISSTEVRMLAAEGRDISGLVPDAVRDYIVRNRLYLSGEGKEQ